MLGQVVPWMQPSLLRSKAGDEKAVRLLRTAEVSMYVDVD